MSALAGLGPTRGVDRRVAPRREVDRCLHYATQNLLGAALAVNANPSVEVLDRLRSAADNYRRADAATRPGVPA